MVEPPWPHRCMSDLVERLRAAAEWSDAPWWWDSPDKTFGGEPFKRTDSPASLFGESAEEVEGLRSAVSEVAALLYDVWRCNTDDERAALGNRVALAVESYHRHPSKIAP